MDKTLYRFNSSQDVINLQTKFTLFKRVVNIVFSTTVEKGFDEGIMTRAINKVIERNDCLRITFVKKGGETLQYFADHREIGKIKSYVLDTPEKFDSFVKKFRRKPTDCYKGDVLRVAFAVNPQGQQVIFFKISHFVADDFAIGVIVSDLFAVYDAMVGGKEMPAMPSRFEDVLKKDNDFLDNEEAKERDRQFFQEYFTKKHPETPQFCPIQGNNSGLWLKNKRKGKYAMPFLFIDCDTEGYKFDIPVAIVNKALEWSEKTQIPPATFFYYAFSLTVSLLNDRYRYILPLMLLNSRATSTERHCGGTKVQSIALYTEIDYSKSFNENVAATFEDQNELYRHTKLTYLETNDLQHKFWKHSLVSQLNPFCFSFIPSVSPEGVKLMLHSNGKGALATYVAIMMDINTHAMTIVYDQQTEMGTPQDLVEFNNRLVGVIEKVLDNPEEILEKIF